MNLKRNKIVWAAIKLTIVLVMIYLFIVLTNGNKYAPLFQTVAICIGFLAGYVIGTSMGDQDNNE